MPSQTGVGEQLEALLKECGLSQRELGRRLTHPDPSETFERRWKAKTRWVQKVLPPSEVERPTDASLDAIERAAGRPGWFIRPDRPRRESEAERARTSRRLEELEAYCDELRRQIQNLEALGAETAVGLRDLREVFREALEVRLSELESRVRRLGG